MSRGKYITRLSARNSGAMAQGRKTGTVVYKWKGSEYLTRSTSYPWQNCSFLVWHVIYVLMYYKY